MALLVSEQTRHEIERLIRAKTGESPTSTAIVRGYNVQPVQANEELNGPATGADGYYSAMPLEWDNSVSPGVWATTVSSLGGVSQYVYLKDPHGGHFWTADIIAGALFAGYHSDSTPIFYARAPFRVSNESQGSLQTGLSHVKFGPDAVWSITTDTSGTASNKAVLVKPNGTTGGPFYNVTTDHGIVTAGGFSVPSSVITQPFSSLTVTGDVTATLDGGSW